MPQLDSFSCAACGSGGVINIPTAIIPKEEESYDDFDLGPAIPAPVAAPRAVAKSTAAKTVHYQNSETDKESRRFAFSSLTDPARDLYVPTSMIVAGFLGAMVWAATTGHGGQNGIMVISLLAGLSTLVKTTIIIGLALLFAPMVGISFGLLQTAILKFAAIIIFCDVSLIWLEVFFKSIGGISANNKAPYQIIFVLLGCTTTLITISSYYLFNMDLGDIATFAIPLAFVSWLVGFLLNLLVVMILTGLVHATAVARAQVPVTSTIVVTNSTPTLPAPVPASPTPAAPTPTPASAPVDEPLLTIVPTQFDKALAAITSQKTPFLPNAREWERRSRLTDPGCSNLIDLMYDAGAKSIHIEMQRAPKGTVGNPFRPGTLIVELPLTQSGRDKCMQGYTAYRIANNLPPKPATQPAMQQFLIVDMKK